MEDEKNGSYIELCVDTAPRNSPSTTHPVVKIELSAGCHDIYDILEYLFKPALLASGYTEKTVDRLQIIEESV